MGGGYLYMKKTDSLDITIPPKDNKVSNVKPVSAVAGSAGDNKPPPIAQADLTNQKVEKF